MTEENKHNEQQPIPLDQALKTARLAANLTVEEVAQRLNLKPSVIENLENDLETVIASEVYPLIYLRGYLINYGKELKLPDVESYPEFQSLSHPSESVTSLQNTYIFNDPQKRTSKILLVSLLLFTAVIMTVVYYSNTSTDIDMEASFAEPEVEALTTEVAPKPVKQVAPVIEEPVPEREVVSEEYVAVPDIQPVLELEEEEDITPVVAAATPEPVAPKEEVVAAKPVPEVELTQTPQAESTDRESRLKLLFEEESWAVVTDAKGKRLAFGLYQSGKELDLVGTAPFSLKIGNPTAVVMYYQDQLVENNFVRGKMANFSLPE